MSSLAIITLLFCMIMIRSTLSISPTNSSSLSTSRWVIRERDYDLTCVMIEMSAFFRIKYISKDLSVATTELIVNPDAILTSQTSYGHSCITDSKGFLHFDLEFYSGHSSSNFGIADNSLTFFFQKKSDTYQLLGLSLEYTVNHEIFPNHFMRNGSTMFAIAAFDNDEYLIPRGMSYSCRSKKIVPLDGFDDVFLVVQDLKIEAFTFQTKPVFSPSISCPHDISSFPSAIDWASFLVFLGIILIFLSCTTACFVICRRWKKMSRTASLNQLSAPDAPASDSVPAISKSVAFNIPEKELPI